MSERLTIVPAGAGSGKTYKIETDLAELVGTGQIRADRILAVTFTEAAASELRERLRNILLKAGDVDSALGIDRAYVGTIHALGQRLLTEHAFAAGHAPSARLVTDAERDLLLRRELAKSTALQPIISNLARHGYKSRPFNGESAEDQFRSQVFRTIDLLRGLGERGTEPDVANRAVTELRATYGTVRPSSEALTEALKAAVQALYAAFPSGIAQIATGKPSVEKTFRDNHNAIRSASRSPERLEWDWSLWQKLRGLRQSKRGMETPDTYDSLAQAVIDAADVLPEHPGPLDDACSHLRALVAGAQEIMSAYQEAKSKNGLVDYADMISGTEAMLRHQEEVLSAVVAEIDCVVIDEFQDTNPAQFAVLWRIAQAAPRVLIVGDIKQAIMGFQGADPRLAAELEAQNPDSIQPLDRNWRSTPAIMDFINCVGPCLFPDGYLPLTAQRNDTGQTALEAIMLPGGRKDQSANCIADRIENLLTDEELVTDPETGELRPVIPSDIAVLCYTHSKALRQAAALRQRGIEVRIQSDGWLMSLSTRLGRAALAFLDDPTDTYAALTLVTLGPQKMDLEDALKSKIEGTLLNVAPLHELASKSEAVGALPVAAQLAEAIDTAGIRDWASTLETPEQALADLARLEAEAESFDQLTEPLKGAAGFFGSGPQVFLGWLAAQTERDFDRHPNPDGWTTPGVDVVTWHGAKGLEWPITFLSGLDYNFIEKENTLRTQFTGYDDLSNVLPASGLGWYPHFDAPEQKEQFLESRLDASNAAASCLLYVVMTRARDRLILALPNPPKTQPNHPKTLGQLLVERTGLLAKQDGSGMTANGQSFPAKVTVAVEPEEPDQPQTETNGYVRFGEFREPLPMDRTPWRTQPSRLEEENPSPVSGLTTVQLAAGIKDKAGAFKTATERGTAWHLAFRVLLQHPEKTTQVAQATGLDEDTIGSIGDQARSIEAWLNSNGYSKFHFELPLQHEQSSGAQSNAVVDLLAEGPDSFLILDHKSGLCEDPAQRFASYKPQLDAYRDLVEIAFPDKPVKDIAINWMSEGMLSVLNLR